MLLALIIGSTPASSQSGARPDGTWYWGDLHAHSGLSWDGCEDWAAGCLLRSPTPGADFFDNAADSALDFAALTDHAEADRFYPDGPDGASLAIWESQQQLVQAAQEGPVVALLGYEWTAFREEREGNRLTGTHRTVLLADPDACPDYRVPGWALPDGEKTHEVGAAVFIDEAADYAATPAELWEALSAAGQTCDPVRWVTYAHHPAYSVPQVTDWSLDENVPEQEQVVEIYSEHGSSECIDLTAEGCDWRINTAQGYYADGSAQAALAEGFQLGFVGGTDSHDARPGSIEDGPSHIAHWLDTDDDGLPDTPKAHFTAGGLTGVWLSEDTPLTADAILESLSARTTAASSGPRPDLIAQALGQDGIRYPPGSVLPRSALPAEISLTLSDPGAAAASITIERIGPDGLLTDTDTDTLTDTWSRSDGDWTYLRIRYVIGTEEERVWLSPWFEEPRSCGCTGSPLAGPWWLPLLAIWRLRRR
ncbi:MAG: DUF3604 domain-containing protein [Myxococcota bacterium]|nr:DUF3604 domain-containing protein [Myxococcota bacterium]